MVRQICTLFPKSSVAKCRCAAALPALLLRPDGALTRYPHGASRAQGPPLCALCSARRTNPPRVRAARAARDRAFTCAHAAPPPRSLSLRRAPSSGPRAGPRCADSSSSASSARAPSTRSASAAAAAAACDRWLKCMGVVICQADADGVTPLLMLCRDGGHDAQAVLYQLVRCGADIGYAIAAPCSVCARALMGCPSQRKSTARATPRPTTLQVGCVHAAAPSMTRTAGSAGLRAAARRRH
jgi:hypothetical protein